MSQGIAYGIARYETDPFIFEIIVRMGMPGENGRYSEFLEQRDILLPFRLGEIGIVMWFIDAFPKNGTMEENENIPASARLGKFLAEPFLLDGLFLGGVFHYAVRVKSDERTFVVPESKPFIAPERDIPVADFFGPGFAVIMIARYEPDRRFQPGDSGFEDGVLKGVRRIVQKVTGDEYKVRLLGVDTSGRCTEKRIRMGIAFGLVNETDLCVRKVGELERLER